MVPRELPAVPEPGTVGTPILPYRAWTRVKNIGDAITPYLLRHCFGVTPVHVAQTRPHLLAVGSILHRANAQSTVWGSGLLDPGQLPSALDPARVHALRGRLTLAALRSQGLPLDEVALGDPGILVDQLPDVAAVAQAAPRWRAGLVLHHSLIQTPLWRRHTSSRELRVINVMDHSLRPLLELAACEVVISQSLHGLIFAEALGKPAVWISTQDDEAWRFKFHDWFSTTAEPQAKPVPFDAQTPIDALAAQARRSHSRVDRRALVAALPLARVCETSSLNYEDFETCRRLPPARIHFDALVPWAGKSETSLTDAGQAERLRRGVHRRVAQRFADAAEPRYALLAPPSLKLEDTTLRDLERYMDRNLMYGFLFVAARPGPPRGGSCVRVGSTPSMEIWRGDQRLRPAIFLRPEAAFDLDQPHATATLRAA